VYWWLVAVHAYIAILLSVVIVTLPFEKCKASGCHGVNSHLRALSDGDIALRASRWN